MRVTRRNLMRLAGASPIFGTASVLHAAKPPAPLPLINVTHGTRLYPTWAPAQWWTTEPVEGWDVKNVVSLGAALAADGATQVYDARNTPREGMFTRAYFQFSTPPLQGAQTLEGVVSAAIHCIEWHRRIDATLALQVVVHGPDGIRRGVALPVTHDTMEFTLGAPPKSRAAQNWPLTSVACQDGDVIAMNVGIYADNQSGTLAQMVGFSLDVSEGSGGDIARLDDAQLGNTWVDFSTLLNFW